MKRDIVGYSGLGHWHWLMKEGAEGSGKMGQEDKYTRKKWVLHINPTLFDSHNHDRSSRTMQESLVLFSC